MKTSGESKPQTRLVPKLFTSLKGYTKKQLTKDIVAGILVAVIAFPLSVALAISSGMSPETGLYSAIIGGFFVSAFGGSKVNIGGVTAATVMTVFTIIEEFGLAGLAVASVIAGYDEEHAVQDDRLENVLVCGQLHRPQIGQYASGVEMLEIENKFCEAGFD